MRARESGNLQHQGTPRSTAGETRQAVPPCHQRRKGEFPSKANCYTTTSGERVLVLQKKAKAPARIAEVLWLPTDQPGQWLKPLPITRRAEIPGGPSALAPSVRESWRGQFFDIEERIVGDQVVHGLRPPQIGGLYAAIVHWTTTTEPATIAMPTGTGKTETMLALLARERSRNSSLSSPTDPLRDQVARKFQTFGVLREFGIVGPAAQFPVVGTLKKIPFSVVELEDFFDPCNVVVTTMAIAGRASSVIQEAFARLAIPVH